MQAPDSPPRDKKSQSTKLVELAQSLGIDLFHTPAGEGYAVVSMNSHCENWRLSSLSFSQYLSQQFYNRYSVVPNQQAIKDAVLALEGQARFDSPEEDVYVRVAGNEDAVYVDLVNDSWEAVEIRPDGWSIVQAPPFRFRRCEGMLPLPQPERGGSLDELKPFLNHEAEEDWILIVSWLLGALNPTGPYPILILNGEQGSAKSTTQRLLRALIDPNATPLRAEPTSPRDLVIAARNSWVLSFDNFSYIKESLSDALCRLATGSGFTTRRLYTDDEECHFNAKRPAILNGIPDLATRSDLLDRSILVTLPSISRSERQLESAYWRAFEEIRPRILGALFDIVSLALRRLPKLDVRELPRLADWGRWMIAAEPAIAEQGRFLRAYQDSQRRGRAIVLEASPIAGPIRYIVSLDGGFAEGTATDWLECVRAALKDDTAALRRCPSSPKSMADAIRRLKPDLEAEGYQIEFAKRPGGNRDRLIRIWGLAEDDEVNSEEPKPIIDAEGSDVHCYDGSPLYSGPQQEPEVQEDDRG